MMCLQGNKTDQFSIVEIIEKSECFLKSKGVSSPKSDAEWIVSHILGKPKLELYLSYDEKISTFSMNRIRDFVIQRGKRRPLQHLLKTVDFCGIKLKCDERALVPRNETEIFVELICRKFSKDFSGHIIDFGTGSGAIILSLSKYFSRADCTGIDCSQSALNLAIENRLFAQQHRVNFFEYNWSNEIYRWGKGDLLVSNPPYLDENDWLRCEPEVKDHDPKIALVSKNKGKADLISIINKGKEVLKPSGMIALEIGKNQHSLVRDAMEPSYKNISIEKDLSGVRRYVFGELS